MNLCNKKYEIVSVVVICTNILSRVIRLSTKVPIDVCPKSNNKLTNLVCTIYKMKTNAIGFHL